MIRPDRAAAFSKARTTSSRRANKCSSLPLSGHLIHRDGQMNGETPKNSECSRASIHEASRGRINFDTVFTRPLVAFEYRTGDMSYGCFIDQPVNWIFSSFSIADLCIRPCLEDRS